MTTAREIFCQQHVEYLRVPWAPGEAVSYHDFGQYGYGGDLEPIPAIEVPNARSEDVYGQTTFLEISNFHHLVNNHSDQIMVAEYLNLDAVMLLADAKLPEDFADKLEGFQDYPIFDEEDWSERAFTEWIQSWEPDGYNRADLEYELGRTLTSEEYERLPDVLEELGAYQGETDPCACYPAQGIAPIAAALDPGYKTLNDVVPLVLQDIAKHGGSTRHPDTGAIPTTGYAVSLRPADELRVPVDANLDAVFRHWLAGRTMGPDEYVGAWVDGADVVFDISTVVPGYRWAVARGRAAQQDAIYDIERGKEIRL